MCSLMPKVNSCEKAGFGLGANKIRLNQIIQEACQDGNSFTPSSFALTLCNQKQPLHMYIIHCFSERALTHARISPRENGDR